MNNTLVVQVALLCLKALEAEEQRALSVLEISRRQGLSVEECADVLGRLSQAGLIHAIGKGAYRLERPLAELQALDVVTALAPRPKAPPVFALLYAGGFGAALKAKEALRWSVAFGAGLIG